MADAVYPFSYKEVVDALIKHQGLHEGLWSLRAEFGIGAANINKEVGSKELTPTAIVPLIGLGLQPGTEENSLTVDAAKVNPKAERTASKAAASAAKKVGETVGKRKH